MLGVSTGDHVDRGGGPDPDAPPPGGLGRRPFITGAALGITTLALPAAAEAASSGGTSSTQTLQGVTVDDTGTPDAGDDLLLAVTLLQPSGSAYTKAASVTLTITVDDGGAGGDGSHPDGLTVDGTLVTSDAPAVSVALSEDGTGVAEFSIDLPAADDYLFRISTSPTSLNQPTGVTLTYRLDP